MKMGYMCVKDSNRECDGCMTCKPEEHYICPICGQEVYEAVYVSNDGEVIGCDNCAQIKEPWEMLEEDEESEYQ